MKPSGTLMGVYPRVCGGTLDRKHREGGLSGLSPRVRGNLVGCHFPSSFSRSIPACAGEPYSDRGTLALL